MPKILVEISRVLPNRENFPFGFLYYYYYYSPGLLDESFSVFWDMGLMFEMPGHSIFTQSVVFIFLKQFICCRWIKLFSYYSNLKHLNFCLVDMFMN